jgi:hypothetical protein
LEVDVLVDEHIHVSRRALAAPPVLREVGQVRRVEVRARVVPNLLGTRVARHEGARINLASADGHLQAAALDLRELEAERRQKVAGLRHRELERQRALRNARLRERRAGAVCNQEDGCPVEGTYREESATHFLLTCG